MEKPGYETRVYKLQQASAGQLQTLLTDLFEKQIPSDESKKRTPVVIIPDLPGNALIVSASRDVHQQITELLERLDVPSNLAKTQVDVISLKKAKAQPVADALDKLVKGQQAAGGKGGISPSFSVTADARTLIPVHAQPLQAVVNHVQKGLAVAFLVGVLDAQDEDAAGVAGIQPVEQRRAGASNVEEAGRTRSETNAYL
jgi:type II secretory pathway component GspD/PulD (secretin)